MKNSLKLSAMLFMMSVGVAVAQRSNLDSPHNYKRQNSQSKQELLNSKTTISVPADVDKKNYSINSAHNYKRQGVSNVSSESNVVLDHSTQQSSANPLASEANYKRNNISTKTGQQ